MSSKCRITWADFDEGDASAPLDTVARRIGYALARNDIFVMVRAQGHPSTLTDIASLPDDFGRDVLRLIEMTLKKYQ